MPTVFANGRSILHAGDGSNLSTSTGDEPGTAGGGLMSSGRGAGRPGLAPAMPGVHTRSPNTTACL